jgi:SpoVK/Ycf46/Vps4 family AAA+-type ATPase
MSKKIKKSEPDFKNAIKDADASARRKAFKNKMPVAVSKDGKVMLVYPDNSREELTKKKLKELSK